MGMWTLWVAVFLGMLDTAHPSACTSDDWLVCPSTAPVALSNWTLGSLEGVTLSNGLVSRSWVTRTSGQSAWGLFDFVSYLDDGGSGASNGVSLLRTLDSEASITINCAEVFMGGVVVAGRGGSPNFTLVAKDAQGTCAFVSQGPVTDDLNTCLAACWANTQCNMVNWIAPTGPGTSDCVFKTCPNPLSPPLSPLAGCDVYATTVPSSSRPGVNTGPFLNRSGLAQPGVLAPRPAALIPLRWHTSAPIPRFQWTAGRRGSPPDTPWPPSGITLTVEFTGAAGTSLAGIDVQVHYEMYVGSPSVSKWLTVGLGSAAVPVTLDAITVENLGLNPPFSPLAPLAYTGQAEDIPGVPLYRAAGKLGLLVDLYYASWVNFTNDDLTEGTPGSSQPRGMQVCWCLGDINIYRYVY